MELTKESIQAVASDDYNYGHPLMKGRYCLAVNGYQYWFREQEDGSWEFCNKKVKTWHEVMVIIHKSAILIGESKMLGHVENKVKELNQYYSKRADTWLNSEDIVKE